MSSTSGTMRDTVRDAVGSAKEAVRDSGKAASAASGDIQADLEALRGDVARLTAQIADIFASRGNEAWGRAKESIKSNIKANIEGVMSDASAKGQEAVDAVREVGDNLVDAIDESLKKRPYTTLALAVGIGFLFGATWRR
jgi:ElaB/YqjD/DUF883 family membrane-anchored ribosome-binding protein